MKLVVPQYAISKSINNIVRGCSWM